MGLFNSSMDKELVISLTELKTNNERNQSAQLEYMQRNESHLNEIKASFSKLIDALQDHKRQTHSDMSDMGKGLHEDMNHMEARLCKKIHEAYVSNASFDKDMKAERELTNAAIDKAKKDIYFLAKIAGSIVAIAFFIFEWVLIELPKTHLIRPVSYDNEQPYKPTAKR